MIRTLGFILFFVGILAFILKATGLQFVFFIWLEKIGGNWAFLLYFILSMTGIIMLYLDYINKSEISEV